MPTLSEVYASHPVHLNHLDFNSLRELPETHAWPRDEERARIDRPVPVVDLRDPNVLAQVAHACESWGVFQITGHGVPLTLLDAAESECRRLFSLPTHQKLKALRPPNGISGYGVPRISSFFSKLMWFEGFTIAGHTSEHASKLWPDDHQRFCETMEEYKEQIKALTMRLVGLIFSSLGLPEDDQERSGFKEAASVLQLNSYPACPDPDRAMGLAAHTDSSLLTVLHQSSTSGLQVLRPMEDGGPEKWVTVPPLRGALVVNIGDLFQILSNGRYRSILHRAVVNRTHHRLSMAYIHGPPAHIKISPLKTLIGPTRGPEYHPVTWQEYLGLKAKHFDKALASIRVGLEEEEETQQGGLVISK